MRNYIINKIFINYNIKKIKSRRISKKKPYIHLLTFNFKKRSLYIGLQNIELGCIYTFTSGIFVPNLAANYIPRDIRKKNLAYATAIIYLHSQGMHDV